ncbi:hypothetical protein RYX36_023533 [Vicia faba]
MENKSLNIFNSKLVLASPETTSDADYAAILGVIGHEYFHNWTGNRVTCRDRFQLSLKEGLTVFRDQEFSSNMGSRTVKRIGDVSKLWNYRFPQDAGPMAYPVRPHSYIKMDNFYIVTVYEKGAEVVRMYKTLLGNRGFRKGMDLYFKRHDGQAAGTPVVKVSTSYNAEGHTFSLKISQEIPPTPGQSVKEPTLIPIAVGLLDSNDKGLPSFRSLLWVGPALLFSTSTGVSILGWDGKVRPILSISMPYAFLVGALNDRLLLASPTEINPRQKKGVEIKSCLVGLLEPILIGFSTMQRSFEQKLDLSEILYQITSRFDSLRITPRSLDILARGTTVCGNLAVSLSQSGPQFTQVMRGVYAVNALRFSTALSVLKDEFLEQTSYMRSEREKFGDQKWNDWDQILQRFSTSTKQLHSPSFVKLNLRSIGMLEDVLVNPQKVKKWDILSSEIHSQKFADPQNTRHKRFVEVKILLFNIAYEKAKLQLMNVKRDRLLKKAQQLSSGLQETQMIKNSMLCSAKSGPVDIQADDSHINARLFNSQGKCQVSYEKRMEMRQELKSLDQKAKSLSEFFYSHCKMEGDQSCTNILKSVPDYLEKRMFYKLVFRKLKLWDIEDFERKDDYHLITLNYLGYIIQRFTVNAGLSSIIVSNSLNDVNIGKTYPNMDAFSAFQFALNPLTTSKCTGQISMAQETQITGSLLSNFLDMVEEVQLFRIEIGNLVQAKFNSQSVHQLDLQLSFIDFLGGKKVQVILDMACLKCGAYPTEVLPSQIYDSTASREQNLPSLLVDEIRTAAKLRLLNCLEFTEEDMRWFTLNEHESNIHVAPMWTLASFKRLKHISSQYASRFSLIVAFSPTGWTFGKGKKKSPGRRWQQGTVIRYEVPYSEHSSFTELKEFVNFLSPNNIIPSVNNDGPESAEAMVSLLST